MPEDWSREEVEATVSDYLSMLSMDLRGEEFNKAERNRQLQRFLQNRSKGSVEWKHQNISAVLVELGLPYVRGYKPRYNYQDLLRQVTEERLVTAGTLFQEVDMVVNQPAEVPHIVDVLSILVPPPERDNSVAQLRDFSRRRRNPVPRNFLKVESENRSLGLAGEEFVMRFEHERLWRAGKKYLADRIEHVARTKGDGLGYDIHSFEDTGRDRLIEVKTTRFGAFTPFFATRNEVEVSEERGIDYQVYRLFSFRRDPKLYVLPGSISTTCTLDPVQFVALPQSAAYPRSSASSAV